MKLIRNILIVINIILFLIPELKAQTEELYSPDRTVYWFNVKVYIVKDSKTRQKVYRITRLGKRVYSAKMRDYEKKLWKGLSRGSYFTVGPFYTYQEAYNAMVFYNLRIKFDDNHEIDPEPDKTVFWFLVKLNISERSRSYELQRMAAAVAEGTKSDFNDILRETLTFQNLAIGPFNSALDAEEAKRIYRLEE